MKAGSMRSLIICITLFTYAQISQAWKRDHVITAAETALARPYEVAVIQMEPFLYSNGSGYIPDLLDQINTLTGIRFQMTPVSHNAPGAFNDIVQSVSQGDWDMAAGPITVTQSRLRQVDFTEPFMTTRVAMVLSRRTLFQSATTTYGTLASSGMEEILGDPSRPSPWAVVTRFGESVDTLEEGLRRARESNFAFIVDGAIADYQAYVADPECELVVVADTSLSTYGYGMVLGRTVSTQLKPSLDLVISLLRQNGLLDTLYTKHFTQQHRCSGNWST